MADETPDAGSLPHSPVDQPKTVEQPPITKGPLALSAVMIGVSALGISSAFAFGLFPKTFGVQELTWTQSWTTAIGAIAATLLGAEGLRRLSKIVDRLVRAAKEQGKTDKAKESSQMYGIYLVGIGFALLFLALSCSVLLIGVAWSNANACDLPTPKSCQAATTPRATTPPATTPPAATPPATTPPATTPPATTPPAATPPAATPPAATPPAATPPAAAPPAAAPQPAAPQPAAPPPTNPAGANTPNQADASKQKNLLNQMFGSSPDEAFQLAGLFIMSTMFALLGALFFFANALWQKMDAPALELFNEDMFWAGLWFRLGEAVVFNLVFFLAIRVYGKETISIVFLPLLSLLVGMFLKAGEALVSGIATRVFAAMLALVPSDGKKDMKLLKVSVNPALAAANQADIKAMLAAMAGVSSVEVQPDGTAIRVEYDASAVKDADIMRKLQLKGVTATIVP